MRAVIRIVSVALPAVLAPLAAAGPAPVDFNRDIRPLLSDRCFQCHGPDANHRKAGLRLDEEASAKATSIVPGQPESSEVMARVLSSDPDEQMPPPGALKKPVTPAEAELLRRWIAEGAPWAKHWAFVKPVRAAEPAVQDAAWPRGPIDRFVLAGIERAGLAPAPEAPRETLLRRLAFDLTGLPPTPEAIDAFLADTAPGAYERAVDRLLASPHYGERMAMLWLDGARFADTNGFQNDFQRMMWPWRDWVIEAFNENMPFDRFTVEQLAGDLLPEATESQRLATGFNRNNRSTTEGGSIEEEWRIENLIDRVETTSTVFLGLSMGCARCHEHKYDPVSQKEFYQFLAFFASTEDRGFYEETRGNTGPTLAVPAFENQVRLAKLDGDIAAARKAAQEAEAQIENRFAAWRETLRSAPRPAVGGTLRLEAPLAGDLRVTAPEAAAPARYGGAQPAWTAGPAGTALALDGTPEAHLEIGAPIAFERGQPFTITAWVKPEGPGAVFSKMDDANGYRGVDVLVTEQGEIGVHLVHHWNDNAIRITTTDKTPMGEWTHVAVTYDGSSTPGGIRVYLAGRRSEQRTEVQGLSGAIATEQPVRLGRRQGGMHLKGALGAVRVYERAFTEQKIGGSIDYDLGQGPGGELPAERLALLRSFYLKRGDSAANEAKAALQKLEMERAAYQRESVPSAMIMRELPEPRATYRLNRGQYDQPDKSETLSPALPAFLGGLPPGAPANRLGLAQWIVGPDNPLTARVIVNRIWGELLGECMVKTPENMGTQCEPPAQPELLDWLAVEFAESGWDLKALVRTIVTSATYRQSSAAGEAAFARDPENRLLARGPRHRLAAEMIRDHALAASGLLKPRIGGPSVKPYQPEGLWAELAGGAGEGPYVQATGDDLYRRSMYTYRKRTVPHPLTATFDAPSWEICRVQRARTNTPLQALALLNDVTYVEAARRLAERMLRAAGAGDDAARVRYGFRTATGRNPTDREAQLLAQGLDGYRSAFGAAPEAGAAFAANGASPVPDDLDRVQLAAYTALAGVLLNLDETITKQ